MPTAFHLDDPLDDLLPPATGVAAASPQPAPLPALEMDYGDEGEHWENCRKCRGTGKFYSYRGAALGPCFECKGRGGRAFKTDAETRQAARETATARKERAAAEALEAFGADHPAVLAWMTERAPRFAFAASLLDGVRKYGGLTEKQLATAHRLMAADAERGQAQEARRAARTTELDVSGLDEVFAVARGKGAIKAALRTGTITFSLAKATSKNAGAIYAKRPSGEYLGKITGGRFIPSMECTPADKEAVVEAARDPKGAALRYAAETDRCSVCGKVLTDPVSKANRIGPICADNFGW